MQVTPPKEVPFMEEANPVPMDAYLEALRRAVGEKGGRLWPPRHLEKEVLDATARNGGAEAVWRAVAKAYAHDRPNRRERRRRERAAERAIKRNSSAAHV